MPPGFHGIQAVPAIALLLAWTQWPPPRQLRLTHAAGLAWLALCVSLFWQAMAGMPAPALSAATMLAAAGLGAWVICFGIAIAAYTRREGALDASVGQRAPAHVGRGRATS